MKDFSTNLKLLRKEKGLSQEKLAKLIGVSSRTIQYYEKGEATPKVGTVRKIADILGVDFYELTGMKPVSKQFIGINNSIIGQTGHIIAGENNNINRDVINNSNTEEENELLIKIMENLKKLPQKKQEYYYHKIISDALEEEMKKED